MLCKRGWANNRSTRRRAHNSPVEKQISNTCEIQDAYGDNNKDNGKHWNNEADTESSYRQRQSNYINKLKSSTCTFNKPKHHGTTAS